MAPGVKGRVGQHGNANEFETIQNATANIATPASPARLSAAINVKSEFIGFITAAGKNRIIGAYQAAHGAPDTFVDRIGLLPNTVIILINHGWRFTETVQGRFDDTLAKNTEFNCMNRADRRAFPAKGTFIDIPKNLPWKIFDT
jgi:hypothetical protein